MDTDVTGKSILLATDSLSVVKSIGAEKISSGLLRECIDKLNKCGGSNSITVKWVKGHSGIPQNEHADSLARLGSAGEFHGPEPFVALSRRTINSLIEDWLVKEHNHRWSKTTGLRQAKMAIKVPTVSNKRNILCLSRVNLFKLAALVTGHGTFRYHLKTMGLIEDDICRLCLEDTETAAHIICDCPAIARKRRDTFGSGHISEHDLKDVSYKDLLALTRDLEELWK